jgi:hypothetical protein
MSKPEIGSKRMALIAGMSFCFGGYASFWLHYFETFGEERNGWGFWLCLGLLLGAICLAPAWWLFASKDRSPVSQAMAGLAFLVMGSLGVWVLGHFWLNSPLNPAQLQKVGFHMLLAGLLPIIAALLLVPRSPKAKASELPEDSKDDANDQESSALEICSSSGELALKVAPELLICVEAADNYCKFHYLQGGQKKNKIVRTSMKAMEEMLIALPNFHRCHRSFIINAAYISRLDGSSQAYRLALEHVEDPVPVSRSFNPLSIPQVADLMA